MADVMEYLEVQYDVGQAQTEREITLLEPRINKLSEMQQSQIWELVLMKFPTYTSPKVSAE